MQEVASNIESRVTFSELHKLLSEETRRIIEEKVSGQVQHTPSMDLNGMSFESELHKLKEAT